MNTKSTKCRWIERDVTQVFRVRIKTDGVRTELDLTAVSKTLSFIHWEKS